MNPEIKTRWVDALRSGRFPQGIGRLANKDGSRCCLGVLCELAAEEGVVTRIDVTYDDGPRYTWDGAGEYTLDPDVVGQPWGEAALLPEVVQEWAGLDEDNPTVELSRLAALNDSGVSFERIADLIETNL